MDLELYNRHLNIVFHKFNSNDLLLSLFDNCDSYKSNKNQIDDRIYQQLAIEVKSNISNEEADNLQKYAVQEMSKLNENSKLNLNSNFGILVSSAEKMLSVDSRSPLCKFEYLLQFQEISKNIGQEIFTTSLLAKFDLENNSVTNSFDWSVVINNDNTKLRQILDKGISENHFHLNGSVPVFFLSWVSVVNHPDKIRAYFNDKSIKDCMKYDLNSKKSNNENMIPLKQKLYYASYIRGILFKKVILKKDDINVVDEIYSYHNQYMKSSLAGDLIEELRYLYGYRFKCNNGKSKVLDYAITKNNNDSLVLNFDDGHNNRMLNGERLFLYNCFKNCFNGSFTREEQDIFYLYLLIQNEFYSELVQVNDVYGFNNFSQYQDRKNSFYENFSEYVLEANRLTILSGIKDSPIKSFENRITMKYSPKSQYDSIYAIDSSYMYAKESGISIKKENIKNEDYTHFFVLAFIKQEYKFNYNDKELFEKPRNHEVRKNIEKQAKSLYNSLLKSEYLCRRIRGIDACSAERGCRPETFATEFRFLRNCIKKVNSHHHRTSKDIANLRVTFHAGEDILDIIDGLRSIDETVRYLEYQRGDRLGHALALGVYPKDFYKKINNKVMLNKQDLLDNIIWFLFSCIEFDIEISSSLRYKLENQAYEYFYYIYEDVQTYSDNIEICCYNKENSSLINYYKSWKLRGDHPSLYETYKNENNKYNFSDYYRSKKQKNIELIDLRKNKYIIKLCNAYHFNKKVKKRGSEIDVFYIEKDLVTIIEKLQDKMQYKLMRAGISIECNLTSNVLIGSFKKYHKHPLFRFNNYGLSNHKKKVNSSEMCVSINTDDQGVFATSLENEYAILVATMENMFKKSNKNKMLFSNEEIYSYVDHIRKLSNSQSFHPNADKIFS